MKLFQKSFFGCIVFLCLGVLTNGCTTKTNARLKAQNAFLAGQNAELRQEQSQMPASGASITVLGSVQNSNVPWVVGLTLAQAIATANYVGADEPKQIVITRNGESAALEANVLLSGTPIPLEAGDVIELR